jgi:hypothetical protein
LKIQTLRGRHVPKTKLKNKPKYSKQEINRLQAHALKLWREYDEQPARDLGNALLDVRKVMEHGDFAKWWKRNKLSQARVSYCMRVALNKVAVAKEKREADKKTKASQFVTQKINVLFRSCAGVTDSLAMPVIQTQLREAVTATVTQAVVLAGWKNRLTTPEAHKASAGISAATSAFFTVLSRPTSGTPAKVKKATAGA